MMWRNWVVQNVLCSAYFRFKTKIGIFHNHMSLFFGPKNEFFGSILLRDHYSLILYLLLHKIILLFIRFEFAQESKKF